MKTRAKYWCSGRKIRWNIFGRHEEGSPTRPGVIILLLSKIPLMGSHQLVSSNYHQLVQVAMVLWMLKHSGSWKTTLFFPQWKSFLYPAYASGFMQTGFHASYAPCCFLIQLQQGKRFLLLRKQINFLSNRHICGELMGGVYFLLRDLKWILVCMD